MLTKLVHNVETGEILEVELSADEIIQIEKDKAQSLEELTERQAKATQKATLLERLGISEDEARLLLA
jgi:antitoxin component of MazEF toxin-antitoxin module